MEDGDDDWDLHAVVRRCTTTTTTTTASSLPDKKDLNIDPADTSKQGMNDEPFLSIRSSEMTILPSQTLTISPLSGLHKKQPQQHFSVVNLPKPHRTSNSRPKKRNKISVKKVCHVAAEEVSSDVWSWRKYGQKPIKGSPYPRGYYRCSTSKGCMARKQVERNRSDPGRFILTYTGDHNHPLPTHRSSVSGGSHHMSTGENPTLDDSNIKPVSGKLNMDLDGDFGPLGDDFFEGLEGFTTGGECSKANLDGSGNTFSSSNA